MARVEALMGKALSQRTEMGEDNGLRDLIRFAQSCEYHGEKGSAYVNQRMD